MSKYVPAEALEAFANANPGYSYRDGKLYLDEVEVTLPGAFGRLMLEVADPALPPRREEGTTSDEIEARRRLTHGAIADSLERTYRGHA